MIKLFMSSMFLRVLGLLSNYAYLYLVQKYFSVESWGQFATYFTYLQVAAIFTVFGMDSSLIKYLSDRSLSLKNVTIKVSVTILTLCFVLLISFECLQYNHFVELSSYRYTLYFSLPAYSLSLAYSSIFRSRGFIKLYIFCESTGRFIFAGLILGCLSFAEIAWLDPVLSFVISLYLLLIISLFLCVYLISKERIYGLTPLKLTDFLKNSFFYIFNKPLNRAAVYWISVLFMSYYYGDLVVGIYDTYFRYCSLITLISFAVLSHITPQFSQKYAQSKMNEIVTIMNTNSTIVFVLTLVSAVGLSVFAPYMFSYLSSDIEFSYSLFFIIIVGYVFNNLCALEGSLIQMSNHFKLFSVALGLIAIISVVLNGLLISKHGILGAAIATSIVFMIKFIVLKVIIFKKFNLIGLPFN